MAALPRGAPCARRRRQTSRFEFAAGQGRFGLFAEPVALLVPPLSLFGFSGKFGNWLLVHCLVPNNRSGSCSLNDTVVDGLKSLSSRISGNRTVGAVVEHSPDDDGKAPISRLAHGCPALFPVLGDAIVQIHDSAGERLLGLLRPNGMPRQVTAIMDVPVKPQASIHASTLYTALTLRTSVTFDQRLAFTGAHLGDFAVVEDDAADQLHVEVAHVEEAAPGLVDHAERLDKQIVEGRALGQFFLEPDGFGGQIDIGELLDGDQAMRGTSGVGIPAPMVRRTGVARATASRSASVSPKRVRTPAGGGDSLVGWFRLRLDREGRTGNAGSRGLRRIRTMRRAETVDRLYFRPGFVRNYRRERRSEEGRVRKEGK